MPTTDDPIRTDADLVALVADLIGSAIRRQTWLLLFDADDRSLPVLIPVDGMPFHPDRQDVAVFADRLRRLVEETDAASIAVVWERPGPADLRTGDAPWVAGLQAVGLPVRAQLLASDDGVRLLDAAREAA